MKISVIGLGKLGLPLTTTIASKGYEVIGVDLNETTVSNLNKGTTNLKEPDLQDLIKKNKERILATTNTKEAILNSDVTFVITPTPSKSNGQFSLKFINPAAEEIAKALKIKKTYHLVVIVSTVMPGSTDNVKVLLEKVSGKSCGKDFGICYNPEFIALGSVIQNLLNPDFVLIGESDKKAGDLLEKFYKKYCDNKPNISRMNFVNAELTKISVNTYITTKISYANMLAEICEKLPGGNVDVVTSAIGQDSRIGTKYLKGAVSFGGPCFPRDNVAFTSLAEDLKITLDIPKATQKTNIRQIKRLAEKVLTFAKKNSKVAILGLSYKPNTDVIEESSGLLLAQELLKHNIKLNLHDPIALDNTKRILNSSVKYFEDLEECINQSDILVITTNWPEYKKIKKQVLTNLKVIIDPWRMLDPKMFEETIYIPLGVNIS